MQQTNMRRNYLWPALDLYIDNVNVFSTFYVLAKQHIMFKWKDTIYVNMARVHGYCEPATVNTTRRVSRMTPVSGRVDGRVNGPRHGPSRVVCRSTSDRKYFSLQALLVK